MGFRGKVKEYWRALLLCLALLPLCGCYVASRGVAIVNVPDKGEVIQTKYRYYCIAQEDYEDWLQGEPTMAYKRQPDYERTVSKNYKNWGRHYLAKEFMPDVFADDGVPLLIDDAIEDHFFNQTGSLSGTEHMLSCVGFLSFGMLSAVSNTLIYKVNVDFWLATAPSEMTKRSVRVCSMKSEAMSNIFSIPWALFWHSGTPDRKDFCDFEGGKLAVARTRGLFPGDGSEFSGPEAYKKATNIYSLASYYGIAVRLKEMEDAGIITDKDVEIAAELHARRKRALSEKGNASAAPYQPVRQSASTSQPAIRPVSQPTPAYPQPVSPPASTVTVTPPSQPVSPTTRLYRIVESERESGDAFARRFVLEVLGDIDVSTERTIRREYIEDLKLDYAETYGMRDLTSIYVDFTQFSLKDRRIEGRAVVFTATPDTTMQYDAHTRRGKITVRFNSAVRGTDWARGWARRNIETLVRDKNILLTTSEKPPEGHYLSRGEQWYGDVLEIEFETE